MINKKNKQRWSEAVYSFVKSTKNIAIPVITKNFKGDPTTPVSFRIPSQLKELAAQIYSRAQRTFTTVTEVDRAAYRIGIAMLYEMYGENDEADLLENWEIEERHTKLMNRLDDAIRAMGRLYTQFQNGIIGADQYNELVGRRLDWLEKFGLRPLGEEKLKQIIAGAKVVNILECKQHGGSRVSNG